MALLKSRLVIGLCIVSFVLYAGTVAAAEGAEPSAAQEGNTDLQGELLPTATASKAHTSGSAGQQQHQSPLLSKGYLHYEEHKALLPIDLKDVVLFLLSFMVLSLAAGAGIGEHAAAHCSMCMCIGCLSACFRCFIQCSTFLVRKWRAAIKLHQVIEPRTRLFWWGQWGALNRSFKPLYRLALALQERFHASCGFTYTSGHT